MAEPERTQRFPLWIYKPTLDDDEEMKLSTVRLQQNLSLVTDTEVETFQIVLFTSENERIVAKKTVLYLIFTENLLRIEDHITIPLQHIRFAVVDSVVNSKLCSAPSRKITVAYRSDNENVNDESMAKTNLIHFCPEVNDGHWNILILTTIRKLLFGYFNKISNISDAGTVVNQMMPLFMGIVNASVTPIAVESEGEAKNYFCTVEFDSLSLYENAFSCEPLHVFHFVNLPGSSVVNKVSIHSNEEMFTLQSKEYVFEMKNQDFQFIKLVDAVSQIKIMSSDIFSDTKKMIKHFVEERPKCAVISYNSEPQYPKFPYDRTIIGYQPKAQYIQQVPDNQGTYQLGRFSAGLNSAEARHKGNDQIEIPWIVAEEEIKLLISDGFTPETDFASGGLDSNNIDHFMQCIREIEDNLSSQRYDVALARLQGTRDVFSNSELVRLRHIFEDEDLTLLRKIYFNSFPVAYDYNEAATEQWKEDGGHKKKPWFVIKVEINKLIENGFVPETDFASAGLDPTNRDHFIQCFKEIEDHLSEQKYDIALSRMQGTRKFFSDSTIYAVRKILNEDDVTVMKKIYLNYFSLDDFYEDEDKCSPKENKSDSLVTPDQPSVTKITDLQDQASEMNITDLQDELDQCLYIKDTVDTIQPLWVPVETELKEIIDTGFELEPGFENKGLNPNNSDHLIQCIKEIGDNLMNGSSPIALARMRETRQIFSESTLPQMKAFLKDNDMDLLKKIFFRLFN